MSATVVYATPIGLRAIKEDVSKNALVLSISSRVEDILIGGASLKTIQDTVVLTESGNIVYKEIRRSAKPA